MRLRNRITSTVAALAAATAVIVVPGGHADAAFPTACPTSGAWEVCFNTPTNTPADGGGAELINRMIALTDATGPIDPATGKAYPGSVIRLNTYQFGSKPTAGPEVDLADALKRAAARGVPVGIISDANHNGNIAEGLLADLKAVVGITVKFCNNSCIHEDDPAGATSLIDHSKFMTFKSVQADGTAETATAVTSSNFIPAQRSLYQNMVITRDADTQAKFNQYWDQLASGTWLASWDTPSERNVALAGATLFAFPTTTAGTSNDDPVANWINSIEKCTAGTDHRRVRVLMNAISPTQRPKVATALKNAAAKGCGVQVITSNKCDWLSPTYLPAQNVRQAVGTATAFKTHDKVVLIDAATNAGGLQKVAYTGSANVAGDSIRGNDDLMLKVTDDGVADKYFSRFSAIWNASTVSNSCSVDQTDSEG